MWGHGAREARGAREGVRGARQGSRESEEWDKEQVLIVWHHCMVPLYGTTVWCHCMVPLYGAIVWCHCMAPFVQHHCTAPLYGTTVWYHCTAPLYGTTVWHQGARGEGSEPPGETFTTWYCSSNYSCLFMYIWDILYYCVICVDNHTNCGARCCRDNIRAVSKMSTKSIRTCNAM